MKKFITYLMCAAAMSALALSCAEEEIIEVGEPDADGCQNVYFQDSSFSLKLSPEDEDVSYSIPIYRSVSDSPLTLSLVFEGDEIFSCADVEFAQGETESEVVLYFGEELELDVTYSCTLTIEGEQYVSIYTSGSLTASFSVIVQDNWVYLGQGLYTDDIITGRYSSVACVTWWVDIEEKESKPGYYRMLNPYADWQYNGYLEDGDFQTDQDYNIEIDASNPNAVYFTQQDMGIYWSGMLAMWSYVDYYQSDSYEGDAKTEDELAALYGTFSDGVITFPASSLIFVNETAGKFLTANKNSGFKLVLPDYATFDYSAELSVGLSVDGVSTASVTNVGNDVEAVKYGVFEGGSLSDDEIEECVALISADTACELYPIVMVEESSFEIEISDLDPSGDWTMVMITCSSVSSSEGVYSYEVQETYSAAFKYLKVGDSMPFFLDGSAKASSRDGADPGQTIAVYLESSDVIEAKMVVLKSVAYEASPARSLEKAASGEDLSDSEISLMNTGVCSKMISGLIPNTDYTIIVWATNGFEEQYAIIQASTESAADGYVGPISSVEDMIGTYSVYVTTEAGGLLSDPQGWVIAACDDVDDTLGPSNIRFTNFMG